MILGEKWAIPNNWGLTNFNTISEINPKLPFSGIDDDFEVSFIPMKNVEEKTGIIDLSEIRKYGEVKKGFTKFIEGDIIFAKITPCMENGKIAITYGLKNNLGFGSTEFHVIRLSDEFVRKYFYYYLIQDSFKKLAEQNFTGTVGQRRVPTDFLKEAYVPIPPFNEQVRIVAKIEELFSRLDQGVKTLQETQQKLEQYKKAVLAKAFSGTLSEKWRKLNGLNERDNWDHKTVGEISDDIRYGYTAKATEENIGPKFLRITDIQNDAVNWDTVPNCKIDEDKVSKFLLKQGDIVFARTGATVGKSYLIRNDTPESIFASYLIRIKMDKTLVSNSYIYYFFKSPLYWNQIKEKQVGIGQPNVNASKLAQIKIPLPSKEEQEYIIQILDKTISNLDTSNKTINDSINSSKAFKQSILKRAFGGSLVPQDLSDEPASALLEKIKAEKGKTKPKSGHGRKKN